MLNCRAYFIYWIVWYVYSFSKIQVYSNYLSLKPNFFQEHFRFGNIPKLNSQVCFQKEFLQASCFCSSKYSSSIRQQCQCWWRSSEKKRWVREVFQFCLLLYNTTKFVLRSISLPVYVLVFILVYFTSFNFDHSASTHIYIYINPIMSI